MNPSSSATTSDQYIAQLDDRRREQVGLMLFRRLDDLDQDVLQELLREAASSPAASAT